MSGNRCGDATRGDGPLLERAAAQLAAGWLLVGGWDGAGTRRRRAKARGEGEPRPEPSPSGAERGRGAGAVVGAEPNRVGVESTTFKSGGQANNQPVRAELSQPEPRQHAATDEAASKTRRSFGARRPGLCTPTPPGPSSSPESGLNRPPRRRTRVPGPASLPALMSSIRRTLN